LVVGAFPDNARALSVDGLAALPPNRADAPLD
jgi:hypothetical protein